MANNTSPSELYKNGILHLNIAKTLAQSEDKERDFEEIKNHYKEAIKSFKSLPKTEPKYYESYFSSLRGYFLLLLEFNESDDIDKFISTLDSHTRDKLIKSIIEY